MKTLQFSSQTVSGSHRLKLTLMMLGLGMMSACGVTQADKQAEKKADQGVEDRVNQEKVAISPSPGTYPQPVLVRIALASPNNYTEVRLSEGSGYKIVSCPDNQSIPIGSACANLESSATLSFHIVGKYTNYGPILDRKNTEKEAVSAERTANFIIK